MAPRELVIINETRLIKTTIKEISIGTPTRPNKNMLRPSNIPMELKEIGIIPNIRTIALINVT